MRPPLIHGLLLTFLLGSGLVFGERSQEPSASALSIPDILKKTRETYASLTSYSDEGEVVFLLSDIAKTTSSFKMRLARPNFYRFEYFRTASSISHLLPAPKARVIWSDEGGHFSDEGHGIENFDSYFTKDKRKLTPTEETSIRKDVLSTTISKIPCIFFDLLKEEESLDPSRVNEKRLPDERIDGIDCYVFSSKKWETRTLWIGKQDFLIHQIRTVMTVEDDEAQIADFKKRVPNSHLEMSAEASDCTETHTKIVINPKLVPADVAH